MNDLFMSGNAMLADVWLCCRTIEQTFLPEPLANILGLLWDVRHEQTADRVRMANPVGFEQRQILANGQRVCEVD
jgi:hypothetical protein